MAGRYLIATEITFSASHALRAYRGDCARVHGHNWIARVCYEFDALDDEGLTIDYRELRAALERVILPRFDHRHLNEAAPFDRDQSDLREHRAIPLSGNGPTHQFRPRARFEGQGLGNAQRRGLLLGGMIAAEGQ